MNTSTAVCIIVRAFFVILDQDSSSNQPTLLELMIEFFVVLDQDNSCNYTTLSELMIGHQLAVHFQLISTRYWQENVHHRIFNLTPFVHCASMPTRVAFCSFHILSMHRH